MTIFNCGGNKSYNILHMPMKISGRCAWKIYLCFSYQINFHAVICHGKITASNFPSVTLSISSKLILYEFCATVWSAALRERPEGPLLVAVWAKSAQKRSSKLVRICQKLPVWQHRPRLSLSLPATTVVSCGTVHAALCCFR